MLKHLALHQQQSSQVQKIWFVSLSGYRLPVCSLLVNIYHYTKNLEAYFFLGGGPLPTLYFQLFEYSCTFTRNTQKKVKFSSIPSYYSQSADRRNDPTGESLGGRLAPLASPRGLWQGGTDVRRLHPSKPSRSCLAHSGIGHAPDDDVPDATPENTGTVWPPAQQRYACP